MKNLKNIPVSNLIHNIRAILAVQTQRMGIAKNVTAEVFTHVPNLGLRVKCGPSMIQITLTLKFEFWYRKDDYNSYGNVFINYLSVSEILD